MQLRPYQQEAIQSAYEAIRASSDPALIVLPTGCHERGHQITMSDGSTCSVEGVAVGDQVMGPDGLPRNVVALHQGEDDLYRVTPTHGFSPFVVNAGHVLALVKTASKKNPQYASQKGGGVVDIPLSDWLSTSKWFKHIHKLHSCGFDLPESSLPIPAYMLGVFIGDGCLRNGINVTKPDIEIREACMEYAASIGCGITVSMSVNHCPSYKFIDDQAHCAHPNRLRVLLEGVGLYGKLSADKFVPRQYMLGSRQQRLDMIAGLLDTDGHMAHCGYDFISKSEQLSNDLVRLCRSVGLAAKTNPQYKECQTGAGGIYHRVSISGDCSVIPCRIQRKKAPARLQIKDACRTGFMAEPIGRGEYFGFELDGDRRYLDGQCIVHHNSGKSAVIATMALDAVKWKGRCLILSHVRELIDQVAETIRRIDVLAPVGIYSAGLNKRETDTAIVCAGIQSVYNKACDLGKFNLILMDECHLLPPAGTGMYRTFIEAARIINPNLRIVGMTATDFRLDAGYIHGADKLFPRVCYEAKVRDLIDQGYLSNLRGKDGGAPDLSEVHLRGGEYIAGELEVAMTDEGRVKLAMNEIMKHGADRKAWLIFCCGVAHAKMVSERLALLGVEAPVIVGDTPSAERKELIDRYKAKGLRCLVSVGVLTTGFDAPHVDLVVLMRPTKSPGLLYQMVGRGLRTCEFKADCMILDLAGSILEHGPVDDLRIVEKKEKGEGAAPTKSCPTCQEILHASVRQCSACGYEFPREIARHDHVAYVAPPLAQTVEEWLPVNHWDWCVHNKKSGGKVVEGSTQTLRIMYYHGEGITGKPTSEWICLGHSGFARGKAEKWWADYASGDAPKTALEGLDALDGLKTSGSLRKPKRLLVRTSGQFPEILKRDYGEEEVAPVAFADTIADDDCPF